MWLGGERLSANSLSDTPRVGVRYSGTTIATYLFGEEGLDMYLPGNGILFEEGIHATIANTAGVTITFT